MPKTPKTEKNTKTKDGIKYTAAQAEIQEDGSVQADGFKPVLNLTNKNAVEKQKADEQWQLE